MANFYMIPGGAGTKSGTSWANAFSITEFKTWVQSSASNLDVCYVYSGTYTTTTISSSISGTNFTTPIAIIGVDSTSNEPPLLSDYAYGTDRPQFNITYLWVGSHWGIQNLRLDCTITNNSGLEVIRNGFISNCEVKTTSNSSRALYVSSDCVVKDCHIIGKTRGIQCVADSNLILNNFIETSDQTSSNEGIVVQQEGTVVNGNIFKGWLLGIEDATSNRGAHVINNTFDGDGKSSAKGLYFENTNGYVITNNIFKDLSVGIEFYENGTTNTLSANNNFIDNNNFYNCTTDITNSYDGPNNVDLDPEFTDEDGDDYSVGTNMKGIGYPSDIEGSSTNTFIDIGAAQREESGGETIDITII